MNALFFLLGIITFISVTNFADILFIFMKVRDLEEELKELKYIEINKK